MNVTRADRLRLEAIVLDRSAPQKHVWRAVPEQSIDAMAAALDGLMKREAKIIAAARVPGATAESIKAAMKD